MLKLKVLFSNVGIIDHPSGIFYRSFNLAKELAKMGHDVTFLTTQDKQLHFPYKKETREGVKMVSFPSFLPKKVKKLGYALMPIVLKYLYIRKKGFDVCHADNHRPTSYLPLWLYSKKNKNSVLVIEWMDYFGKGGIYDNKSWKWKMTVGLFDNLLEKKSVKSADGVVVLSEYLKNEAIRLRQNNRNVEKVWGGSDVETIDYCQSAKPNRKKYDIPKSAFVISAANMSEYEIKKYKKDLLAVLEALPNSIILRTGIISESISADFKNRMLQFSGLSYNQYCDLLSTCDAFVLIQENSIRQQSRWPNIIGDFLAAGRPIIIKPVAEAAVCVSQFPEAFINLDMQDDQDALKTEVQKKTNSSNLKRIRQIAESEFSWYNRAKQLADFYSTLTVER